MGARLTACTQAGEVRPPGGAADSAERPPPRADRSFRDTARADSRSGRVAKTRLARRQGRGGVVGGRGALRALAKWTAGAMVWWMTAAIPASGGDPVSRRRRGGAEQRRKGSQR